jgi:ribosomal-protein-alanine N-acetyltransferase
MTEHRVPLSFSPLVEEHGLAGRAIDIRNSVIVSGVGVQICPARLSDLWALWNLQRRCFSGSQAYGLVTLSMLYFWPKAQILVAWSGERPAGCVVGDAREGQARILNLCVDPDFRRRGVGSLLLSTAEAVLGMDQVTLMVEDKNLGAQELYRSHGYLPVGDLRNYYGRNRHGILMQKRRSAH